MPLKTPLLFLCHRIPFPPNKGDKIRSYHLLRHLSERFDIYLATFVDDPDDWQWVAEVERYCVDSLFIELKPVSGRLRSLSGLVSGRALSMPYYYSSEIQTWVNARVSEENIAHLLVYSAVMSQYVLDPALSFDRRVIDFVDIDSDKWEQYASLKRWPMNWVYRREGKLLLGEEREVAAQFDASLFVSSAEADLFKKLAPESEGKISFYNNGVDTVYFNSEIELANPYKKDQRVIVFTGAMDYWPNIDAVVRFTAEVLPGLLEHDPDLHLYIVGSGPTSAVTQLEKTPQVTVTGRVEDVRPYLKYAAAAIAPMHVARGVQNKVLEAMAMGKPVIVSTKGLEGIAASNGEQVLVADSAQEIEQALRQVLDGLHPQMGAKARLQICRNFNWDENLPEVALLLSGQGMLVEGDHAGV